MKKLMKALSLRKAKYLKRTGSPGHYKYIYKEAGAKTVAQISMERMRSKLKSSFPESDVSKWSESEVKKRYRKDFDERKTMKDAVAARGKTDAKAKAPGKGGVKDTVNSVLGSGFTDKLYNKTDGEHIAAVDTKGNFWHMDVYGSFEKFSMKGNKVERTFFDISEDVFAEDEKWTSGDIDTPQAQIKYAVKLANKFGDQSKKTMSMGAFKKELSELKEDYM